VKTSLPTKVYEITTKHIVKLNKNIINGYEKFVKTTPMFLYANCKGVDLVVKRCLQEAPKGSRSF
jgi:hypothetical protein